jgi:hypothetical protein
MGAMPKKPASRSEEIRKDAQGQFARGKRESANNGVSSARPRVITGVDDSTTGRIPGDTSRPAGTNGVRKPRFKKP